MIRPYYLRPDGKVGHDAFAVIRETIREMNKVAIGRVVLTNREHIIALEPFDKGLMGTLLRYPYEVRSADEYFDDIQDVKVTKDMLDLARHIVNQKAGHFEPDKFEDQYETALIDLIKQKRAGKPITAKARPSGENVVDLMDALRKSIGAAGPAKDSKPAKKPRKVASGQKEMLMPIAGKKPAKEGDGEKTGGQTAAEVGLGPRMAFRVLIIGGTGQVGTAVVRALTAEPFCAEVVMVNRRAISPTSDPRVRQVILDTADAQFPAEVTKLAQSMVAQGDPVYGASCVGVGKGSMKWSEEELKALEIGVVGGFARGCQAGDITQFSLLSAVGSTSKSRIRYVRVMGLKEEAARGIGFQRLAIFRPGIIAGNAHTPRYVASLGRLIPGRFGTIEQDDIGRAFVAEFVNSSAPNGVVYLENGAMRQRSRALK